MAAHNHKLNTDHVSAEQSPMSSWSKNEFIIAQLNEIRNTDCTVQTEALEREKELRGKRSDDQTKMKQLERSARDQVEHLTRKCACLRKLFDDLRAKLSTREQSADQQLKAKDREIAQLRTEVARLTKILMEQSSPKLGARTRADGCETEARTEDSAKGPKRASEPYRKRPTVTMPVFPDLAPNKMAEEEKGRKRANSVDLLPAVQVPGRIKQLQERNKEFH